MASSTSTAIGSFLTFYLPHGLNTRPIILGARSGFLPGRAFFGTGGALELTQPLYQAEPVASSRRIVRLMLQPALREGLRPSSGPRRPPPERPARSSADVRSMRPAETRFQDYP